MPSQSGESSVDFNSGLCLKALSYGCHMSFRWPLLVLCLPLLATVWTGLGSRTVSVAVYDNPPKVYLGEDSRGAGILMEILAEIARREGWQLKYVPGSWEQGMERVQNEEVDLMPDLAYNPERARLFAFHKEPMLASWSQIFARKGLNVKSIPDMAGLRIAVLEGSIQESALKDIVRGFGLDVSFLKFSSFDNAFRAVKEGRADLAASNMFYGTLKAASYGMEITSIVFEPSNLFFGTRPGTNQDVLDAIDRRLAELKRDQNSPYYRAIRGWLPVRAQYVFPAWTKVLALVLMLGLAFTLIASIILRRQVRLRTAELSESNHQMETKVMLRTAELERAMRKAQESDLLKSAFLATMSHELRTPLNSIIGFTGILLQELPGKINDEQRKQLSIIQKSSRHLLSLINEVLDLSKIEAGQLDLEPSGFALADSIHKIYDIMLSAAQAKNLKLTTELNPPQIDVFTDQRRLEQIIINLVSNAVKFTERGEISIRCGLQGDKLRVAVRDSGIGIAKEDLLQLFQPF